MIATEYDRDKESIKIKIKMENSENLIKNKVN